jgi:transposase
VTFGSRLPHTERLPRLEQELQDQVNSWRLNPVVDVLPALRGVQFTVAVTTVAEIGALTRFDSPRELMQFLGLIPSEYSPGAQCRQGSIPNAGNTHARRVLVEGAWAYRYPAKVSRHLPLRLEKQPNIIQDISWKAPVRLCKRYGGKEGGTQPTDISSITRRILLAPALPMYQGTKIMQT